MIGNGINGFKFKNIILDAEIQNSSTINHWPLIHTKQRIKIIGDKSLSKRDFYRVTEPLRKFGAKFQTNKGKLPITIKCANKINPIEYYERRGSAQCKSSIMLAALNTEGETLIKAKKSRNHTELLFKHLKLPIKINQNKNFDLIKINGKKKN